MKKLSGFIATVMLLVLISSCNIETPQQVSDSGAVKATVKVQTDQNNNTVEQKNIMERLKRDNEIGSIKHLYIISSFSGDVMEYSTVKGKVTSGGKRLSPEAISNRDGWNTMSVNIDGHNYATNEVLGDDGAYGQSGQYLFWFDTQGNYHQYYPSGGTYVHISDKPLVVHKANYSLSQQ